jgi:hypothetical protein
VVRAACRKRVTQFRRGEPLIDPGAEMIDATAAPGLIMLNGPSPLLGGDENVHAYAPLWELGRAIDHDRIAMADAERAFDEALRTPSSALGLLSQDCYRWLDDAGRAERFLAAMIRHWDALDALGPRYTFGSRSGVCLWELPHLLKYVLARRGTPQADLVRPLPDGGLAALAATRAAN